MLTDQTSNIEASNIILNSDNNINLEASKLNASNQINLNASNDVNILALNSEYYRDTQTTSKGTFSKSVKRDMEYKETVNSAELNANDIYISSGNDINLEAVNINASNEKIAHAENSLSILAKTYKEGVVHHTKKSSFGGLIKSEYKFEKDNLKIKSSEITANNMILDAKTINLEASKLKANSVEISTDILNMISSKESLYENEFSNKGGVITATIENQGKIEEIVIPSTIEVNDKLIFNKKDITDKLDTNELIKTLSSQGDLTEEQINLVKEIANSKEWHEKTTTLSGMGALIITAVVIYFTAGAGAGVVGATTGTTITAASATATQLAVSAAIDAVIVQATTSLASSVITGNKLELDLDKIATSAVIAGVLSYANATLGTNALTENMNVSDYVKNASINGIGQGISSEIRGGEFKDGFTTGAVISLVSDSALQMRKYIFDNYNYVGDGELSAGLREDGRKGGGSHPVRVLGEDGKYKYVDVSGLTGGSQMKEGTLFGSKYINGGFFDKGVEYFSGSHDFMSSWNYQNIDGVTSLKDNGALVNIASGLLLIPSTPFAVGTFIQDYSSQIEAGLKLQKDNKEKQKEAINNAKDKR